MSAGEQHDSIPARRATVLCIDDDPMIPQVIRVRLEAFGVNVLIAVKRNRRHSCEQHGKRSQDPAPHVQHPCHV